VECGGKNICEHKKHRSHCVECGGRRVKCRHNRPTEECRACEGLGS